MNHASSQIGDYNFISGMRAFGTKNVIRLEGGHVD
jgi:hypothetical protein